MSDSYIVLDVIEFVENSVYKIKFSISDGRQLTTNARISKYPLENGESVKGLNFDSDEIGKIAAHYFVDLKSINAAIFAFHDAQSTCNVRQS